MNFSFISVIIVNFNAGPLLTTAVGSVLSSTLPVEVIVLDNGSTDNSLDWLRRYYGANSCLHVIENGKNLGFAQASNRGLQQAQGEYLLLLNPDAVVQKDTLARMVQAMQDYPEAGMAGCMVINADGTEQAAGRRRAPTPSRSLVELLPLPRWLKAKLRLEGVNLSGIDTPMHPQEVEAISGSFMFVRRAALEEIGLLDEGYFLHCEDLDWCMRFRERGWKILFVPDARVTHHKGACSKSRPIRVEWHKHCGMVRFHNKFFRNRYPALMTTAVWVGTWLHFALVSGYYGLLNVLHRIRGTHA